MIKHSFTLTILLVIFYSSNIFGQCADLAQLATNGNCLYLTWDTPPSPMETDISTAVNNYSYISGTGTSGDPSVYNDGGSCPQSNPPAFTGSIVMGNLQCTYASGGLTSSNPLPVSLINFLAKESDAGIKITWSTASEYNNKGFELFKSSDAKNWRKIADIEGAGNASEVNRYQFVDQNPGKGLNYYQLKQVDFDGEFEIFDVISVEFDAAAYQPGLFPNPTSGVLNLNAADDVEIDAVKLFNRLGSIVAVYENDFSNMNLGKLPKGIYLAQIISGRKSYTQKVILE